MVIGGLACLFCSTPASAKDECPSFRTITSLKYSIKATKYVRNSSAKDLTDSNPELAAGEETILGHAGGRSGVRFSVEYEAAHLRGLSYCLQIKKIKAVFYTEPVIHIASNFRRGSCEYGSVVKHERQHVKILHRAHRLHISKYRAHLRKMAREFPYFPPVKIEDMQKQQDDAVSYINKGLSEYMNYIGDYVAERQKELDTPEEYQRVNERCKRWDKKLKEK